MFGINEHSNLEKGDTVLHQTAPPRSPVFMNYNEELW